MDNKSKIIQNLNILEKLILNLTNNLDTEIIKHYNLFLKQVLKKELRLELIINKKIGFFRKKKISFKPIKYIQIFHTNNKNTIDKINKKIDIINDRFQNLSDDFKYNEITYLDSYNIVNKINNIKKYLSRIKFEIINELYLPNIYNSKIKSGGSIGENIQNEIYNLLNIEYILN